MSKRQADHYLTDQNWDQEDPPEEAGHFTTADPDVLKTRVFKKAKRRTPQTSATGGGVFSGFSALSGGAAKPTAGTGFNMPNSLNKMQTSGTFGANSKNTPLFGGGKKPMMSFAAKPDTTSNQPEKTVKLEDTKTVNCKPDVTPAAAAASVAANKGSNPTTDVMQYNIHLTALNKSVCKWISEHVDANPLCDLTPIFKDYQKHLRDIEDKFNVDTADSQSDSDTAQSSSQSSSQDTASTATRPQSMSDSSPPRQPTTIFSDKPAPAPPPAPPSNPLGLANTKPTFAGFGSFGNVNDETPKVFSGFKFGAGTVSAPVSAPLFTNGSSDASAESGINIKGTDGDDYVPPKPESNIVEEEGAFYTQRCKLFYMGEDKAYNDKGVGYLHLKPVPATGKTQLIVRADTTTGTLLLNIVLHPLMPIAKQGKNNVTVSCVPNPPITGLDPDKIVMMLIRVKTSDDADALLNILDEKKSVHDSLPVSPS